MPAPASGSSSTGQPSDSLLQLYTGEAAKPLPTRVGDLLQLGKKVMAELEEMPKTEAKASEAAEALESLAKAAVEKLVQTPKPIKPETNEDEPLNQQRTKAAQHREQLAIHEESSAQALIVLAKVALTRGKLEEATEFVKAAEASGRQHLDAEPWLSQTRAMVQLQAQCAESKISDDAHKVLETAAADGSIDEEGLKTLALSHASRGDLEPAVDAALALIRKDRNFDDAVGKRIIETVVRAIGQSSALAKKTRRRFRNVWYV